MYNIYLALFVRFIYYVMFCFIVIVNEPETLPYLTALMPTAEDAIVPTKPDKASQDSEDSANEKPAQEPADNPFLKPPKRRRTTART
jgi:hypothetical protein